MTTCAHCAHDLDGSASVGDSPLCHPGDGLDCYRLVTIYGHAMPCTECVLARASDDEGWDVLYALAAERAANDGGRRYSAAEVLALRDPSNKE